MFILESVQGAVQRYGGDVVSRLPMLLAALVVLVAFWAAAGLVQGAVRRVMAKTSTEGHVDSIVGRISYWGVLGLGLVAALATLGVSPAAQVAGLGAVGLALGFALRDTLASLIAGVLVLVSRPFSIGDAVRVEAARPVEGVVEDIKVKDTVLRDYDGTLIFVPNATVYMSPVVNLTASPKRRADVVLPVELDADLAEAGRVAEQVLAEHAMVLGDPPAEVLVTDLQAGAVTLTCRFWVDQSSVGFVGQRADVAAALKKAMDASGVKLRHGVPLAGGTA